MSEKKLPVSYWAQPQGSPASTPCQRLVCVLAWGFFILSRPLSNHKHFPGQSEISNAFELLSAPVSTKS
jgi:hypothetical protein